METKYIVAGFDVLKITGINEGLKSTEVWYGTDEEDYIIIENSKINKEIHKDKLSALMFLKEKIEKKREELIGVIDSVKNRQGKTFKIRNVATGEYWDSSLSKWSIVGTIFDSEDCLPEYVVYKDYAFLNEKEYLHSDNIQRIAEIITDYEK